MTRLPQIAVAAALVGLAVFAGSTGIVQLSAPTREEAPFWQLQGAAPAIRPEADEMLRLRLAQRDTVASGMLAAAD
jgi:hypothetical protein